MKEFILGDCMEGMKGFEDNFFDLAIVDPPYGIETLGNAQDRFTMGKSLELINDAKPTSEYFAQLMRVSKNQIIWGYNHLSDMLPSCREFIFWYKHQPVVTFSDGELAWTSFKKTARCFDYSFHKANSANRGQKIHPTQKPIALYHWLLRNYAQTDFKVLSTHVGSASDLMAFEDFGCEYVGYEIDNDYYEPALKRLNQHKSQLRLL